jgi:hypothetical protein
MIPSLSSPFFRIYWLRTIALFHVVNLVITAFANAHMYIRIYCKYAYVCVETKILDEILEPQRKRVL